MENIDKKIIAYLERTPDFQKEILLRNDGSGNYIFEWNATDKPKPTDEQLNALETETTKIINNNKADANRKKEYLSVEEQLDYIYHNGIDKWKTDHIKPIKDKYPKE